MGDVKTQSKMAATEELKELCNVEELLLISSSYATDKSSVCNRKEALAFLEKVCKLVNFDVSVPYLGMVYYDRFMSLHKIPMVMHNKQKNKELFMVSCLALAWVLKLNSSDLDKFLLEQELSIDGDELCTMLESIQRSLRYRCRGLTPLCFARRYFNLLSQPLDVLKKRDAYQIIIWVQADIAFTKFKPSILAAAAVRCVIPFPELSDYDFIKRNEVISCRNMMVQVVGHRLSTIIPLDETEMERIQTDVIDDSAPEVKVDIDKVEQVNGNQQNQNEVEQELAGGDNDNPLKDVKLDWIDLKPPPPRRSFYQWLASRMSGIYGVVFHSAIGGT